VISKKRTATGCVPYEYHGITDEFYAYINQYSQHSRYFFYIWGNTTATQVRGNTMATHVQYKHLNGSQKYNPNRTSSLTIRTKEKDCKITLPSPLAEG